MRLRDRKNDHRVCAVVKRDAYSYSDYCRRAGKGFTIDRHDLIKIAPFFMLTDVEKLCVLKNEKEEII